MTNSIKPLEWKLYSVRPTSFIAYLTKDHYLRLRATGRGYALTYHNLATPDTDLGSFANLDAGKRAADEWVGDSQS